MNSVNELNENLCRELMELHTLGVNGGYTQTDVEDVARAFTGWTHNRAVQSCSGKILTSNGIQFMNRCQLLPGGQTRVSNSRQAGMTPGQKPCWAARCRRAAAWRTVKTCWTYWRATPRPHTSSPASLSSASSVYATAGHSSSAPPAVFQDTDGDIRSVLRTIVTSPLILAAAAHRAKVKTPIEFVLSARRALAAPVGNTGEVVDLLIDLGQTPFGRLTPDGWPKRGTEWINTGSLLKRINLAARIASDELPSIPIASQPPFSALIAVPFDRQVKGVIDILLHGQASARLRAALAAERPRKAIEPADASLHTARSHRDRAGNRPISRVVEYALAGALRSTEAGSGSHDAETRSEDDRLARNIP